VLSAAAEQSGRFLASRWGSGRRGGGRHPGREEGRLRSGRRSLISGATADDSAAAVHRRRGGALAEDGGGPRGEGAGHDGGALVDVGRALLEDGRVVGGAAVVGDDGGAQRENLAA
jgi:hypothetical protein